MNITPMGEIERDAVEAHLTGLIDACNNALGRLRKIPKANRPPLVEGQIQYWKNARGAFKWAIQIANQRTSKHARQSSDSLQQLRTDTRHGRGENSSQFVDTGGGGI